MSRWSQAALSISLVCSGFSCAARPNFHNPRVDRIDGELNTPAVETPGAKVADAPAETPSAAAGVSSKEVTGENTQIESTQATKLAEESGSGVNNGIGPAGALLTCKGTDSSLTLRGTAVIGLTSGTLKMKDREVFVYCRTNDVGVLWCENLDMSLTVEIAKTEKLHKAIIRELAGEPAQARVIGTMDCVKPKD